MHLNLDFNSDIAYDEVKRAASHAKIRKSTGIDKTATEVQKMTLLIAFSTLFLVYFSTDIIPVDWNYSIITLIPKSSMADS